ncbi:MAG: di-heme oxidoredictase family protein [Paracoccaceae bacterium]
MSLAFRACLAAVFLSSTSAALAEEPAPTDQSELNVLVAEDPKAAFLQAFAAGGELTEALFTSTRGVGAKVTGSQRFTKIPRADLADDGEWAAHVPPRQSGPQAQACITCHAAPYASGAGGLALNVAMDPLLTADPAMYLERNTLHLFALGAVQRIAEEMTAELQGKADLLGRRACQTGTPIGGRLGSKGVDFGILLVEPRDKPGGCEPVWDTSGVEGVDEDLVVRMFGWKGTHATIRAFSRRAAHNQMGMQAVELVGNRDGDGDGVTAELSVGDLTAISVYIAGLERPTSKLELDDHGIMDLGPDERAKIETGRAVFDEIGCATCHKPSMVLNNPVFSEPSATSGFRDEEFPSGEKPAALGLATATSISFDLTADTPNNHVKTSSGKALNLGAFMRDTEGRAIVEWFSDFRRHDMGPALADPVDAHGFGASVWPTRSLAGVGSTGPWLHNGHATSLDAAIRAHGGEAASVTRAYLGKPEAARAALIAFLENLIIIDLDPEAAH